MKSAIAIITYNRLHALKETLAGINKHCTENTPVAIFEDCGQSDGTETFLKPVPPADHSSSRPELLSLEYDGKHLGPKVQVFLGTCNLGVAGNSNRAIRWFETMTDCDHLCLLNDDLHVLGNFVNFYAKAHTDLEIGMFSFCDFTHDESYRWITVNSRGYRIKLCPRMTGIMMSFTRPVVEKIGYFDCRFGKFGQEHCDYMNRARMARFIDLDGRMQGQIDLESNPPVLKHQDVQTSVTGSERVTADNEANRLIQEIAARYGQDPIYKPFKLRIPKVAAGLAGVGIPVDNLVDTHSYVDSPA